MNNIVDVKQDNKYGLVTTSRVVANGLGKRHTEVLRSIDKILENADLRSLIIPTTYKVEGQKREYKEYLLTKDGFTLYMFNIQGYNDFKMAYIREFNRMERILKGEQLELKPYELKKKTYKGEPVMVTRDIEFLSGNDKSTINFYIRENNLGRLLSGRELNEFKFENEDYHSVKVSMNILYKSDVVKMLDYFYRLDDNKSLVDEYFKNIAIENKKAGLTEGKKLIKLIALGELKIANIRLAIRKEMKEEITYAISKEYVKLGFLDKPCYNLDINSREGWNLNIKLNDYYWKVKQS